MLNIGVPDQENHIRPKIVVMGVGGAGGNAVKNMMQADLQGVEFVVANTDAQALSTNRCEHKITLGETTSKGLGAGSKPEIGKQAAQENHDEIAEVVKDANMVFITAGMGGGTGTGAAPVIADICREAGILTIGVVTKPFGFEGISRMKQAEAGISELQEYVDTLIVIPNQNLFIIADDDTTFADAFGMADQVLHEGVRGITDLMVMPGLINLDFNDIRTVMSEMGKAMMGTGQASGEERALDAAKAAISNPLLDDVTLKGARSVLINITGSMDIKLREVDEAANFIRDQVDENANIIFGSTFNEELQNEMRVSVVATGIETEAPKLKTEAKEESTSNVTPSLGGGLSAPTPSLGASQASSKTSYSTTQPMPQTATQLNMSGSLAPSASAATSTVATAAVASQPENLTKALLEDAKPKAETAPQPKMKTIIDDSLLPQESSLVRKPAEKAKSPKKKGPSLWERVSKLGRRNQPKPMAEVKPLPQAQRPFIEENEPLLPAATKPQKTQEELTLNEAGDEQNGISDDLLDIPTFLRKQAN